jgi:hypothetical protein
MPTAPRTVFLIVLLSWLSPAQAFFCFSFGGHAKGNDRHNFRQHYFRPPPPLFAPRIAKRSRYKPDLELPAVTPAKEKSEIIQGFRFRPLNQGQQSEAKTPAHYQQK